MNDEDSQKEEEADEVIFEDEEETANPQAVIKKLRTRIKKLEEEKQEYLTGWQKDKADFVNLRKRDDADKESLFKFANENLILELLPAIDSFEQARKDEEAWNELPENWRVGMESSIKKLLSTLEKAGLKPVGKTGESFDPKLHEAVSTTKVTGKEDDHVVMSIFQTGYELNGRVIRPAKVVVGEYNES
jgi:molecular chaperone GrpE